MSPHALYFFHDLGARERRRRRFVAAVWIVFAVTTLGALAALAVLEHRQLVADAAAAAAPVRSSQADGRALPALDELAAARLDGFRAGLREAQEQGCTLPPALRHPLDRLL